MYKFERYQHFNYIPDSSTGQLPNNASSNQQKYIAKKKI